MNLAIITDKNNDKIESLLAEAACVIVQGGLEMLPNKSFKRWKPLSDIEQLMFAYNRIEKTWDDNPSEDKSSFSIHFTDQLKKLLTGSQRFIHPGFLEAQLATAWVNERRLVALAILNVLSLQD
jgi:hypothetical protein